MHKYHSQFPDNLYYNPESSLFLLPHLSLHIVSNQLVNLIVASKFTCINPTFPLSWWPSFGPLFNYITTLHQVPPTLIHHQLHSGKTSAHHYWPMHPFIWLSRASIIWPQNILLVSSTVPTETPCQLNPSIC